MYVRFTICPTLLHQHPPSPTLRFDKSLPFIKILPFLGDGEDEKDDDEDDDDEA